MTRFLFVLTLPACLALGWGACQETQPSGRPAYKDARQHRRGYFGPGREEPEPQGLAEVAIGYFGPADPQHPVGGAVWMGTAMAIEEANAEGGYKGTPFRLKPGWSENPWAGGVSTVVRMAYLERVWAIIGSIDGSATHLAEQVVAKARITQIDPASTDTSVNMANVPWVFSCLPGDLEAAAAVGQALLKEARGSFAVLSATDHDSRALSAELKSLLKRNNAVPKRYVEFPPGVQDAGGLAAQVCSADVEAVVVLAAATASARVVRELRRRCEELLVLGGPSLGRAEFRREAGNAAEEVRFPLLAEVPDDFAGRFSERYGTAPDYAAVYAYDAARLLTAAIRKGGLNRVRIRDAVEELSPWKGVSGSIEWDTLGRATRPIRLGVIRGGRIVPP